jgi:exodeoxyribonuclease-5
MKALEGHRNYFVLAGYAGTGKSTLVNYIISELGLSKEEVITVAPTGKAANELIKKGVNAATVASAFYRPTEISPVMMAIDKILSELESEYVKKEGITPLEHVVQLISDMNSLSENPRIIHMMNYINHAPRDIRFFINTVSKKYNLHKIEIKKSSDQSSKNEVVFTLRDSTDVSAKLIIIDEAFMLDDKTINDIKDFGKPVVFAGDFFQLEPINGENSLVEEIDIILVDITRQALDNPIVRATLDLRNGRIIEPGNYGNKFLRIKEKDFFKHEKLAQCIYNFDQILAGKNKTVKEINQMIREGYGFTDNNFHIDPRLPQVGEKIICTKNNIRQGIVNGTLATVTKLINMQANDGMFYMNIETDTGRYLDFLKCNAAVFIPEVESEYNIYYKKLLSYEQFDFGYCLTNHKFQGSSAPRIVVFEEAFGKNPLRWYYTAWTRAEQVVISLIP